MSEKNMYTILQVHNYYQIPGGEDTVVANEKKILEQNGHKVITYYRNNSEIKKMNLLQKLGLPLLFLFNLKTYTEIKKIIREEKIDIVHVHNTLNLISPAVYYAAIKMKIPVIQTLHNFRLICPAATLYRDGKTCEKCLETGLMNSVKYACYRNSRLQTLMCVLNLKLHKAIGIYKKINYIYLTEFNRLKMSPFFEIDNERIYVKPNFSVECNNIDLNMNQRKQQYVFVGRLEKIKGIDKLLEAWKVLGTEAPNLIVCGDGPLREWCEKYIQDNHLNTVSLKGQIKHKEVIDVVKSSKALIFPTQVYEGFPMGMAEAMSCGTPIICSDYGNAGSLVIEGKIGLKFQKDSVIDLCKTVQYFEKLDEKTRIEFMMNSYLEYTEKYNSKMNLQLLEKIYADVIEREC